MYRPFLLILALAVGACGGGGAESLANDSARQAQQIANQARELKAMANSQVSAIEQAMENEGAVMFENRGNLLNQTAPESGEGPANATR